MSFCENNILFSAFHDSGAGVISNETVDYIDWPSDVENAGNLLQKKLVTGLIRSSSPDIRIIFAPLDLDIETLASEKDRAYALQWQRINHTLFERYDVPPDFLQERLHSACLGSGSRAYEDGSNAFWLHYLCKNVDIEDRSNTNEEFPQITDHHPDKEIELHKLSQTNWTWLRAGFFLKWGPLKERAPNGSLMNPVTLLCFGASQAMKNRFGRVPNGPTWRMDIDPFQLFVIVLDELFQEMDKQVWNLSDVFRGIEHKAFLEADQTYYSTSRSKRDFAGLHNIAKYCIYLKEAFKAIDLAIEDLSTEHNRLFNSDQAVKTKARLKHKRGLFKSVSLRLDSLDKRTQNILDLSFNLVAQQDNSVMLKDSKTMKAIAIVTMFFLPATSVAAICGSQFFGLDTSQSPPEIRVAGRIWIFCIVAVVTTGVVLGSWWMLTESTLALHNERKKRWNNWLFRRPKQRKQNDC